MVFMHVKKALVAVCLAIAAAPSLAQDSSRVPVRLVVPFTPGTGIDMIARQIGPRLADRLGRPVVVDNRPGASGNIGTQNVVRAEPDGSTFLVTVNTIIMNRALYPDLPFNPVEDLQPVARTSWGQLILVASAESGITSAQQLIEQSRSHPGELNYGSPGAGTPHHLATELWLKNTGTKMTHVPYRGTGPALTDLLGGQIDVMFLPIHVANEHVKTGRLHALAISSSEAHPLLPDTPPLSSLGFGEMEVDMWYGVMAPKGTPDSVVQTMNRELKDILALPEVRTAFELQGMSPAHSSPEEFAELIRKDAQRWEALIKEQGIKAD
jgi:tripartite-type tricarboxylate transporter receptor subunit TctC